jgi:hypothetical protein
VPNNDFDDDDDDDDKDGKVDVLGRRDEDKEWGVHARDPWSDNVQRATIARTVSFRVIMLVGD